MAGDIYSKAGADAAFVHDTAEARTELFSSAEATSTIVAAGAGVFTAQWKPDTTYAAGDVRTVPTGEIAIAAAAHNSGSTFDPTKWTLPGSLGRIVALGTSIAAAYGATNAAAAYPARTAAHLANYLGQAYQVIAAGVSGNTTTEMLARLPLLLAQYRPQVVTIEVSVNDSRVDRSVSTQQTMANLRRMIALARLAGARPVLITSVPFDPVWFNSASYNLTSTVKAAQTNAAALALATEQNVAIVDMFTAFAGTIGVSADGLHPNDVGHNLWGQLLATKIAAMVVPDTHNLRLSDSFDRADSASGIGAAEIGGTWTQWAGTWGIVGNRAEPTSATAVQYSAAVLNLGQKDGYAEATLASRGIGLIARGADNSNYYVADLGFDGIVRIFRRVGGTFTTLYTGPGPIGAVAGDRFGLAVEGSHLTAYLNGYAVGAATDATLTTGNFFGVWNGGASYGANTAQAASFRVQTSALIIYSRDSFTRANGPVGVTEVGGFSWLSNGATHAIASNQAKLTVTSNVNNDLFIDDGQADGTISGVLATYSAPGCGIAFRLSGTNNATGYLFWQNAAGGYTLSRRTASNTYTQIAATTGVTAAAGDLLEVVLAGASITCKVNGVTVLTASDSTYTGTRHGFWGGNTSVNALWDSWLHTS